MISNDISILRSIPLSVPEISGNEWKYLKECLESGWVSSSGPFVDRFEREIAAYVGAAHAVATVNGTAALQIALQVAGVKPDDEVLVSNLTFIAPVNAIRYCGANPVLVDAGLHSWQIDVEKLAWFLKEECFLKDAACFNKQTRRRVRAILPVHLLGLACEMDRICELARDYHLEVIEDAAEGMGVRYRGRHVGTFGQMGVFSFNGNKIITSGGGGVLVTDNAAHAEYARYLTTQAKDDELEYIHNEVGYNFRLSNLQAAVGVAQLEQLDGFIEKKRVIARAYTEAFQDVDAVTRMPSPAHTEPTYWLYTILLNEGTTLARRQAIVQTLRAEGIGVRPLWHPIHGLPPYRYAQAIQIEHSISLYERGISLPSSVGLEEAQLHRCMTRVKQAVTS